MGCVTKKLVLKNWLALAEMACWNPHYDVTVRKPISLSFLQQQVDKKVSHAGGYLLVCVKLHVSQHIFLT